MKQLILRNKLRELALGYDPLIVTEDVRKHLKLHSIAVKVANPSYSLAGRYAFKSFAYGLILHFLNFEFQSIIFKSLVDVCMVSGLFFTVGWLILRSVK